ncbi:MAG: pilus assembly protein PilM [Phycisphaeraceae bacterium]|nr:pilus assembly protein PilM [Phycisphaeraceae bacterium]
MGREHQAPHGRSLKGQTPVAIDFGVSSLKAMQMGNGDRPALIAAAALPTPENLLSDPAGRLEFQLEQLPKLIRRGGFKSKRAVCVLPASHTFCKHMQFTPGEGVSTRALVESAIPQELNCSGSALVMRHFEVPGVSRQSGAPRAEAICLATPKDFVIRVMGALKGARLEPVGMFDEFSTLLRAYSTLCEVDEASAALYLDIGWSCTRAMIAHGRSLVFARHIDFGGRHLDEAVATQMGLKPAQAGATRLALTSLTSGGHDEDDGAPVEGMALLSVGKARAERSRPRARAGALAEGAVELSEPLEILTDEIQMCLRYHESLFGGRRADRAVFLGGESRQHALCEHVARALRLPGQTDDPMAHVARTGREPCAGVDFSSPQPGWASVLGAALSPTDL